MKKIFRLLFCLLAISSLAFSFQQFAGTINLDVRNGSSSSTNYNWLLNDEPEPITVEVYTGCDEAGPCAFNNFVTVSPTTLTIPPSSEASFLVTATIPSNYNFAEGNITGNLYARKQQAASGQVSIQLQMSKRVNVNVYEDAAILLKNETNATTAPPTAQQQTPIDLIPFAIILTLLAIIAFLATKTLFKHEQAEKKQAKK